MGWMLIESDTMIAYYDKEQAAREYILMQLEWGRWWVISMGAAGKSTPVWLIISFNSVKRSRGRHEAGTLTMA